MLKDLFYSVVIKLQEIGVVILTAFRSLSALKRNLLLFFLISLIPLYLLLRYGTQLILDYSYSRYDITARNSFVNPRPIVSSVATVLKTGSSGYSAYVQVENMNLELVADKIPYALEFFDARGERVYIARGEFHLLAGEKKYIVAAGFSSSESIATAKFIPGEVHWQKRFSIAKVVLNPSPASVSVQQDTSNLAIQGTVMNASPYKLGKARLVFFLYNSLGKVVAVSQRDEFALRASERRAYTQLIPGLTQLDVARVSVFADTNALDPVNLAPDTSGGMGGSLERPDGESF